MDKRIKARRCEIQQGNQAIKFDSVSEMKFFKYLITIPGCKVIRPCGLNLPGKTRQWKCDFGLIANNAENRMRITELADTLQGKPFDVGYYRLNPHTTLECLYIEFKGETDLTTGLCRVDKNFKSRIDWLVNYADHIMESLIIVGNGTGGILTYTRKGFVLTPMHGLLHFKRTQETIWQR